MNVIKVAKKAINAIKNVAKKIMNAIKFFMSPLGGIVGWGLLIVFIVLLVKILIDTGAIVLAEWSGQNVNYNTFESDLEVISQLYNSGYEQLIDAENFQNFKAFEYAVLIDTAEYIRNSKQQRFDIYENENEYIFERTLLASRKSKEYNERLKALEEEYTSSEDAAVTLMNVSYTTNQGNKIASKGEDGDNILKSAIEESKSSDVRSLDISSKIDISENGTVRGGNNRVMGPFLVYEFKTVDYTSGESINTVQNLGTITNILSEKKMKGSLEPYVYVIKEDIKFSYYFDENNEVIEYPLMLNSYNSTLFLGSENANEVNRATMGLAPVIFPDEDGYTKVPYYSDELTPVIYKIPLRTILGRYMPKAELLQAWAILKENIDESVKSDDDAQKTDDIISNLLTSIKGVYNEACLLNEDKTLVKQAINSDDKKQEDNETGTIEGGDFTNIDDQDESVEVAYYSNDNSNKTSFVTFEKAGIESTKYAMAGLTALTEEQSKKHKYLEDEGLYEITLVTKFISAVIVSDELEIEYKVQIDGGEIETHSIPISAFTQIDGLINGTYLPAAGDPDDGYSPPAQFEGTKGFYCYGGDVEKVKNAIISAVYNKVNGDVTEEISNEYNNALEGYEDALDDYNSAKNKYEKAYKQYEKDLAAYNQYLEDLKQYKEDKLAFDKNKKLGAIYYDQKEPTPPKVVPKPTKPTQPTGVTKPLKPIESTATITVSPIVDEEAVKYNPIFITEKRKIKNQLTIEHTRMPVLLVKSATTWCRKITYNHTITQNSFKQNNKYYIVPKSVTSIGLDSFTTTTTSDVYRGQAYKEVFARMKEKDVINMILQFETEGEVGSSDAYEYMRDLYKLIQASKEYSLAHPEGDINKDIHEDTYKYVYIPDSVLYYDDSQTQKIYWLNLFAAYSDGDSITKEELENVKTKDREITWQMVEYEKYDECNTNGTTKVYALNPFGSAYIRSYYQTAYKLGNSEYTGGFGQGGHGGADWGGRTRADNILSAGKSVVDVSQIGGKIYNYELNRLTSIYGDVIAKEKLKQDLQEEIINMPIVAVAPGEVIDVDYDSRSGFYVIIRHSDDEKVDTLYMHLKRWPLVNIGDYVGAGTLLGYEGCTGRSYVKHLHFQLEKNGEIQDPNPYIYPLFNPFYYKEKASGESYNISSEYMSLYRTVTTIGEEAGSVTAENLTNQVPQMALVNNFSSLIQKQGIVQKTISASGGYGWNSNIGNTKDYVKYLEENEYYDLYNEPACFDRDLALAAGFLDVPYELLSILFGNITVKTDMPGALPALTRQELMYILEHWLVSRYGDSEYNSPKNDPTTTGITKVDWLMQNVFTSETIDSIMEAQEKYKVSAVFMLAVATQEQQLGTSDTVIAKSPTCNIFSVRYGNPGVRPENTENATQMNQIRNGVETECWWVKYNSYGNSFESFSRLIGETGPYFSDGRYTVGTIAPVYCEGVRWGNGVSTLILEIMQFYIGRGWSFPEMTSLWYGSNAQLINAAINCHEWYVANNYDYCQDHGQSIPPYAGTPANGDFSKLLPDSARNDWHSGTPTVDCSTYVSWVLYEYATAIGNEEFANLAKRCDQSGWYRSVGQYLYNQSLCVVNSGSANLETVKEFSKYFQLVWHHQRDNNDESLMKSRIQPGDILAYYANGQGHVEIYVGPGADREKEWVVIYSSGIYEKGKEDLGIAYNGSAYGMTCVIRPMPPGGFPTTNPFMVNTFNFGSAEGFMDMASICIEWLYANKYTYPQPNNNEGTRWVAYKGFPAVGSFGEPYSGKSARIDCTGYVSWVIYEYARVQNVAALVENPTINNNRIKYPPLYYNPTKFWRMAQRIEKRMNGQRVDEEGPFDEYFELVWKAPSRKYGMLGPNTLSMEQIHGMLQPGDILIYNSETHEGCHHGDIFAGWVYESDPYSTEIYKFNAGSHVYAPGVTDKYYQYGNPMPHDMKGRGHTFGCVTAVLRVNF